MHHSSNSNFANDTQPEIGATDRFPGGKLADNDEGELAFVVGILKGKVTINFGKRVFSLGMSPDEARALAHALLVKVDRIERRSSKIQTIYVTKEDVKE